MSNPSPPLAEAALSTCPSLSCYLGISLCRTPVWNTYTPQFVLPKSFLFSNLKQDAFFIWLFLIDISFLSPTGPAFSFPSLVDFIPCFGRPSPDPCMTLSVWFLHFLATFYELISLIIPICCLGILCPLWVFQIVLCLFFVEQFLLNWNLLSLRDAGELAFVLFYLLTN